MVRPVKLRIDVYKRQVFNWEGHDELYGMPDERGRLKFGDRCAPSCDCLLYTSNRFIGVQGTDDSAKCILISIKNGIDHMEFLILARLHIVAAIGLSLIHILF